MPPVSLLPFLCGIESQMEQHFCSVVAALAILGGGFPILGVCAVLVGCWIPQGWSRSFFTLEPHDAGQSEGSAVSLLPPGTAQDVPTAPPPAPAVGHVADPGTGPHPHHQHPPTHPGPHPAASPALPHPAGGVTGGEGERGHPAGV